MDNTKYLIFYVAIIVFYAVIGTIIPYNIYHDYQINHRYFLTNCKIMNVKLLSPFMIRRTYEELFLVQYSIDNNLYESWTPRDRFHPYKKLPIFYGKKDIGTLQYCFYDPHDPSHVYLKSGYHSAQILFLIGSIFFWSTLFFAIYLRKLRKTEFFPDLEPIAEGSYLIRQNSYIIEYTYQGDGTATEETLPADLKNKAPSTKAFILKAFNTDGRYLALKGVFLYLFGFISTTGSLLMLAVIFYYMTTWF